MRLMTFLLGSICWQHCLGNVVEASCGKLGRRCPQGLVVLFSFVLGSCPPCQQKKMLFQNPKIVFTMFSILPIFLVKYHCSSIFCYQNRLQFIIEKLSNPSTRGLSGPNTISYYTQATQNNEIAHGPK